MSQRLDAQHATAGGPGRRQTTHVAVETRRSRRSLAVARYLDADRGQVGVVGPRLRARRMSLAGEEA